MVSQAVDIAMIGSDGEALALRAGLEQLGVEVRLIPIATPDDLIDLVSSDPSDRPPALILSCHGDDRGILMPGLDTEISAGWRFRGPFTPKLALEHVRLSRCEIVLSTGCATGSEDMGTAFVARSAEIYIAPPGYPRGNAAFMTALVFFYHHLAGVIIDPREQLDCAHAHLDLFPQDRFKLFTPCDTVSAAPGSGWDPED
jgi:hypothetical protein